MLPRLSLHPRLLLLVVSVCIGCSAETTPVSGTGDSPISGSAAPLQVIASVSPLAWISSELAMELGEVVALMPAGADPARWTPDDATLSALAAADLIILNGANLEGWARRYSLPIVKSVEVARACRDQWLHYPDVVTHSHGPEGSSSYEGIAGHTWLDPDLLLLQGEKIRDRLIQQLPDHRAEVEQRWKTLATQLEALGKRMSQLASTHPKLPVLTSGPFWVYPAAKMGWSTQRIDLDAQGQWNDGLAADLKQLQASTGARILLWDQLPAEELVEEIFGQTGLISVVWPVADSLGQEHRRYLEIQQQAMDRLEAALSGTTDRP